MDHATPPAPSGKSRYIAGQFRRIVTRLASWFAAPCPPTVATIAVAAITVVMLVCIGWAACTVERRLVSAAGHSLVQAATDAASKLEMVIAERRGDVEVFAATPIAQGDRPEALASYLNRFLSTHGSIYHWIGVTDKTGRLIAATDGSKGRGRDHETWFTQAATLPRVTAVRTPPHQGRRPSTSLMFSAPVLGTHGELKGVAAASVTIGVLVETLDQTMRVLQGMEWSEDSNIEYQLLNADGDVMADSTLGQEGEVNLKHLGLPSARLVAASSRGFIEETHLRRPGSVITAYAQVALPDPSQPRWGILIRVDRSSVLAPVRTFLRKLMSVTALIVVPLFLLLLWLVRTLHVEWHTALRESTRASEAESVLKKRTEALHSLVVAATMLSRERDLDHLLQQLLDITRLHTRADYAALWVPTCQSQPGAQMADGHERVTRLIEQLRRGKRHPGWLVPRQGTIRLADLTGPGGNPVTPDLLSSFLGVPVRCHGRLFGELLLANKRTDDEGPMDFSDLDEQVAQTLATQAGIAIENLQLLEESRQRSRQDSMTGLLNHSATLDALSRELARAEREEKPLAVIMADLDHFKRVNDSHGHAVGDVVIRETAHRLQEATRRYDLVGRIGGEEFLVMIPACDLLSAGEFAERLRSAISDRPIETPAGPLTITVSLGVTAWCVGQPLHPQRLLETADRALYRVKHRGRNGVETAAATERAVDRQVA